MHAYRRRTQSAYQEERLHKYRACTGTSIWVLSAWLVVGPALLHADLPQPDQRDPDRWLAAYFQTIVELIQQPQQGQDLIKGLRSFYASHADSYEKAVAALGELSQTRQTSFTRALIEQVTMVNSLLKGTGLQQFDRMLILAESLKPLGSFIRNHTGADILQGINEDPRTVLLDHMKTTIQIVLDGQDDDPQATIDQLYAWAEGNQSRFTHAVDALTDMTKDQQTAFIKRFADYYDALFDIAAASDLNRYERMQEYYKHVRPLARFAHLID